MSRYVTLFLLLLCTIPADGLLGQEIEMGNRPLHGLDTLVIAADISGGAVVGIDQMALQTKLELELRRIGVAIVRYDSAERRPSEEFLQFTRRKITGPFVTLEISLLEAPMSVVYGVTLSVSSMVLHPAALIDSFISQIVSTEDTRANWNELGGFVSRNYFLASVWSDKRTGFAVLDQARSQVMGTVETVINELLNAYLAANPRS